MVLGTPGSSRGVIKKRHTTGNRNIIVYVQALPIYLRRSLLRRIPPTWYWRLSRRRRSRRVLWLLKSANFGISAEDFRGHLKSITQFTVEEEAACRETYCYQLAMAVRRVSAQTFFVLLKSSPLLAARRR